MGCCGIGLGYRRERAERARQTSGRGDLGDQPQTSGSRAFDEYQAETLRRLEEEQREFQAFLARLRTARDKAQFDQFMADRRTRPQSPASQPPTWPAP